MMMSITFIAIMFTVIGMFAREIFNTVVKELEDIKKANDSAKVKGINGLAKP